MTLLTRSSSSSSWSSSPAADLLRPLRLAVGVWEEGERERGGGERKMSGRGVGGGVALYGCGRVLC